MNGLGPPNNKARGYPEACDQSNAQNGRGYCYAEPWGFGGTKASGYESGSSEQGKAGCSQNGPGFGLGGQSVRTDVEFL